MSNSHRGQVALQVGGRERKIRYTLNSLAELQDKYKKPVGEVFAEIEKFNVKVIRSLIYYGLKDDDNTLTEKQVGSWDIDINEVIQKVSEALALAMGTTKSSGEA